MQFLEQHQADWKDISMVFGLPLGKWSENATEANATVADQTFWADTMWPKLDKVAQQVTADILLPSYGADLLGEFSDVRPKNRSLDVQELAAVRDRDLIAAGQALPIGGAVHHRDDPDGAGRLLRQRQHHLHGRRPLRRRPDRCPR